MVQIILKRQENYGFIQKMRQLSFYADIANTNNFKSFMYKTKLLENTEANGGNGIRKKATIAVP